MNSEQTNELATALAMAQGQMKAAIFNKVNPHFKNKYADLAAVWDAIREPLSKNKLSVTQTIEPINGAGTYLRTTLRHASGQWIASLHPLPNGGKPQEFGSALTYARRYSLASLVGIASDEDDDANTAQQATNGANQHTISSSQKLTLELMISEVGGEQAPALLKGFLKWAGIRQLADLPANRYDEAAAMIEDKRGSVA